MNVLIFGATGFSGQLILAESLARGYHVTALVRKRSGVNLHHPNLTIVEGNVLKHSDVANVLRGQEVVIQCLGVGGKGNGEPTTFVSDATRIIVREMEQAGVRKLIAMSNAGAGNSIAFQPRIFTRFILPYVMKWLKVIIDDKNRMEPIIMDSHIDWTIVRCPNITEKQAKNRVTASLDGKGLTMSITNPDVATFIVDQIASDMFSRQAPSISN